MVELLAADKRKEEIPKGESNFCWDLAENNGWDLLS
jgi:hypothetical protein